MNNTDHIKYKTCQWIGSEHTEPGGCQSATVEGRNYCTEHLWRVYSQGTAPRRRPRKERKQKDFQETIDLLQQCYADMVLMGEIDA